MLHADDLKTTLMMANVDNHIRKETTKKCADLRAVFVGVTKVYSLRTAKLVANELLLLEHRAKIAVIA